MRNGIKVGDKFFHFCVLFGVCVTLLMAMDSLAIAQQWPAGCWNVDVIATYDDVHAAQGGATLDGNMWTVQAGGDDIWNQADQLTYVYKEVTGDFDVTAAVHSLDLVHNWSKAGIMVRENLDPGSRNVAALYANGQNAEKLVTYQRREETGERSWSERVTPKDAILPVTIRLTRRGNEFMGGWSLDGGLTWEKSVTRDGVTPTPPAYVDMPETILIGLAVTSHSVGNLTTANIEVLNDTPVQLLAASYYVLDNTFVLTFNNEIRPDQVRYDRIGFEANQSRQWNFELSDNSGSYAVVDDVDPNKLRVNIRNDVIAVSSLAAYTGVDCWGDVNILLEGGAFTDICGDRTARQMWPDPVPLDIICGVSPFNHLIVADAGENGSISPVGDVIVADGDDQAFIVDPDYSYEIDQLLVDGVPTTINVDGPFGGTGTYVFENVTSNHTVYASFQKMGPFTISTTVKGSGTIEPTTATVEYGQNQNFTITPTECFYIEWIKIDGEKVPVTMDPVAGGTYTFTNVREDHNLKVKFSVRTYEMISSAGPNGTIDPEVDRMEGCGAGMTFTLTPDECYQIADVTLNDDSVEYIITDEETGVGEYRLEPDTAELLDSYVVHVAFEKIMYAIVPTSGEGGSISPSCDLQIQNGEEEEEVEIEDCSVMVACGECQTFTVIAEPCYEIDEVYIDGELFGAEDDVPVVDPGDIDAYQEPSSNGDVVEQVLNTYTFLEVSGEHTIHVTFKKQYQVITVTHDGGGAVEPMNETGEILVECGTDQTFTFTSDPCYEAMDVVVDGESMGPMAQYTFAEVLEDHLLDVSFNRKYAEVTAVAQSGGEIVPQDALLACGSSQTFTVTPDYCYEIESVKVNGEPLLKVGEGRYRLNLTPENMDDEFRVVARFTKLGPYTMTSTSGPNGSISPEGVESVFCGADRTYNVTPNRGYKIDTVVADNIPVDVVNEYAYGHEICCINEDHNIHATFAPSPDELILVEARFSACDRILVLSFNKPIDPSQTRFGDIGAKIDEDNDWDIQFPDGMGLAAQNGQPYINYRTGATLYPVMIDIAPAFIVAKSLVTAAFIDHNCSDIDLVAKRGAFTAIDGDRSKRANVYLDMSINGFVVGVTGDVTGDGEVTAYDAALILRSTVSGNNVFPINNEAQEATEALAEYGVSHDVMESIANTDGSPDGVSSFDAALALQISAGIVPGGSAAAPVSGATKRNGLLQIQDSGNQNLKVSINVDDLSGVYSADITMAYNPQILNVTDILRSEGVSNWLIEKGETEGQLRISLAGVYQPTTKEGSLITVDFGAISTDGIKGLKITELRLNGGALKTSIENLPDNFALLQNYPNPFNPETWIPYRLAEPTNISIAIYNVTGQLVRRLELGSKMPGNYVEKSQAAYWDGKNEWGERVSSGIYFYQLQADQDAAVGKMIIAK